MITEDYVSFETAKLLKEKGFDEKCMSYYGHGEFHLGSPKYMRSNTDRDGVACNGVPYDAYNAPTLQMAMKWLREKKGIAVIPVLSSVLDNEKFLWDIKIVVAKTNDSYSQGWVYEKQEDACETAIKYCLKDLV